VYSMANNNNGPYADTHLFHRLCRTALLPPSPVHDPQRVCKIGIKLRFRSSTVFSALNPQTFELLGNRLCLFLQFTLRHQAQLVIQVIPRTILSIRKGRPHQDITGFPRDVYLSHEAVKQQPVIGLCKYIIGEIGLGAPDNYAVLVHTVVPDVPFGVRG